MDGLLDSKRIFTAFRQRALPTGAERDNLIEEVDQALDAPDAHTSLEPNHRRVRLERWVKGMEAFERSARTSRIRTIYGDEFVDGLFLDIFGPDALFGVLMIGHPRRFLIVGERGTGKERVAQLIGTTLGVLSGNNEYLPLNAAALADDVLQSTLFGHVKGAFTGASSNRMGVLEVVGDRGTVFLDEIADTSEQVQRGILRVLQSHTLSPLGGEHLPPRHVRFHFLAATNRPEFDVGGRFGLREDLFDRLAAPLVRVPALRTILASLERPRAKFVFEMLVEAQADEVGEDRQEPKASEALRSHLKDRKSATIANRLLDEMAGYNWPGNLREAAALIRRVLYHGQASLHGHCAELRANERGSIPSMPRNLPLEGGLHDQVRLFEREVLAHAMQETLTVQALAARLAITRQTAARKMREFGLSFRTRPEPVDQQASTKSCDAD